MNDIVTLNRKLEKLRLGQQFGSQGGSEEILLFPLSTKSENGTASA